MIIGIILYKTPYYCSCKISEIYFCVAFLNRILGLAMFNLGLRVKQVSLHFASIERKKKVLVMLNFSTKQYPEDKKKAYNYHTIHQSTKKHQPNRCQHKVT